MILKTKMQFEEESTKGMSKEDKEIYEAKKAVLGDDFDHDEEYDKVEKNVIIDTDHDHLYVEDEDGYIVMRNLLQSDIYPLENGSVGSFYSQITYKGNLDEIYAILIKEKENK